MREEGRQVNQLVEVDTQAAFGVFSVRVALGESWVVTAITGLKLHQRAALARLQGWSSPLKGGARILRGWPWLRP